MEISRGRPRCSWREGYRAPVGIGNLVLTRRAGESILIGALMEVRVDAARHRLAFLSLVTGKDAPVFPFIKREGEFVQVGPIKIMVLEAGSGRARLGIEAPKDIAVNREELGRDVHARKQVDLDRRRA